MDVVRVEGAGGDRVQVAGEGHRYVAVVVERTRSTRLLLGNPIGSKADINVRRGWVVPIIRGVEVWAVGSRDEWYSDFWLLEEGEENIASCV